MTTKITLGGVRFAITGEPGFITAEDAKWELISRGAFVMTSVSKTTGALIVGANPAAALVSKARKLGTPIVEADGLRALLGGASLRDAIAGRRPASAPREDLRGKRFAIVGKLARETRDALKAELERHGGKVVDKPSSTTDVLIVGEGSSFEQVDAMNAGTPFLKQTALEALLAGAPLSNFIATRGDAVPDPRARALELLAAIAGELVSMPAGERWEDELTIRLTPTRVVSELRDLGGTPLHDHVREVVQRQAWPGVSAPCSVTVPIVFA